MVNEAFCPSAVNEAEIIQNRERQSLEQVVSRVSAVLYFVLSWFVRFVTCDVDHPGP